MQPSGSLEDGDTSDARSCQWDLGPRDTNTFSAPT
jgi:hypothetical protein